MSRFDAVDRVVIRRLQLDGRTPYEAIAEEAGVDAEEVERRVRRLEAEGVFAVVAVTGPLELGFPRQAMLGLDVDGDVAPVAAALAAMDEVIYLVRVSERIDLLAEVVGASDARLLELVAQIRRVPGVRRIHTALVHETIKETYAFGTR